MNDFIVIGSGVIGGGVIGSAIAYLLREEA
jgi:L-2-hydroxyglutarate oxidase LhgO